MGVMIVTGFFDIGRGKWNDRYARSLTDYMKHFSNMLQLKADMTIYTELKFVLFIEDIRRKYKDIYRTHIITTKISDLYMYRHIDKIEAIQKMPEYLNSHPNPSAPEISKPLYNVVTCSKMDMVAKVAKQNPEHYYIWMDAGYTHSTIDLENIVWNPKTFLEVKDKMFFIGLKQLSEAADDPHEFFRQYIDVIIGGFFGGYGDTVIKVRDVYYKLIEELFDEGLKDDDQFYNTLLAKRYPDLFHVNFSSWYSALYI
jgi:protein YibB